MSLNDELTADYVRLLGNLSQETSGYRRVSKNEAILDYVRQMHEIWYSRMTDNPEEMRHSLIATTMSKSVAMLLEVALQRLGKAVLSERAPNFAPTDDGDPLGDEFTAAVLMRHKQLELELSDPMERDVAVKVARCLEDVRQAIASEFERQRATSWAQ